MFHLGDHDRSLTSRCCFHIIAAIAEIHHYFERSDDYMETTPKEGVSSLSFANYGMDRQILSYLKMLHVHADLSIIEIAFDSN